MMIKRPYPLGGGGGSIEVEITADNQVSKELNKIKGDAEGLEKSGKGAGKSFDGLLATAKKLGAIAGISMLGKKVVDFGKSCVEAYSQFEQLEGGVQQLFGKSAPQVIKNASEAYKTAGMSMNQYLESATNFSAKLISDLGGNTELATKYIDKAMVQMSDNANTFGTSLDEVQRAYQSLARGNYAMLDSLKLGYGGTKAEMERLLADAEKLSGQKFEMGNFSDLIDAIQIVQDEFNITGKTALESATTIEGSINSMKGAWENWKVALGTGENVEQTTKALLDSFGTVVDNVVPVIEQMIPSLGDALSGAISSIDLYDIAVTIGSVAWNIADGVVESGGDVIQNLIDTMLGKTDAEKEAHRYATDITSKITDEINNEVNSLDFHDAGIKLKANWEKSLNDALQSGDLDSARKILDDINKSFEEYGSDTRFEINAEGEFNVTNTNEIKKEAWEEVKNIMSDETMESEDKVEVLTDFIIKAREDGNTDEEIDKFLKEHLPEDGELVEQAEAICEIEAKAELTNDGQVVSDVKSQLATIGDKMTLDERVQANLEAEVNANVTTEQAESTIRSRVNQVVNLFKNQPSALGNKTLQGSASAQITDDASSKISAVWTKVKSAWDTIKVHLGSKNITGSVTATITTTIKNVVKRITDYVDAKAHGMRRAIAGGIADGMQSQTTFGSDGMMQYFVALAEGFEKIAERIQNVADKTSKASTKAINESEKALEENFKKLDEIVKEEEELEKRQAELTLKQAEAKKGTGKDANEIEANNIAYERARISLYKLSDEYKNLQKAQEEEEEQLENLKREQEEYNETVKDVTEDVDKLYKSYSKNMVNNDAFSNIDLDSSYSEQKNVVRAMEQLAPLLDSLRAKGMPDALIQQLLKMNPVEAVKLAKKYDKMRESSFGKYMDVWSRQTTANTNLNVIDAQTDGRLEDLLEDLKEIAEDVPKELSDAILHGLTWKQGDWFGMGKEAVANLKLTWETMTVNDLAKLLAPQIQLEMKREK